MSVLDRISLCVKSDVSVKSHACSRSDINMSKTDLSVRLDIYSQYHSPCVDVRSGISVQNHIDGMFSRSDINILDQVSVLPIVLMPVCRSEINKTKSDLSVRSGISVMNHVNVSVK